jgi:metal-dependent amidase/aminoacylase/carboxypeptidase family protein
MNFAERVEKNVRSICDEIAQRYGGSVEYLWKMSTGAVYNHENIVERFAKIAENSGIDVQPMPQRMSSEDFGWFLEKVPGMIFRFGTRNEELGCTALAH